MFRSYPLISFLSSLIGFFQWGSPSSFARILGFLLLYFLLSVPIHAEEPSFRPRYLGNGSGLIQSIVMGDMDGNGSLDIITGYYGQSIVYLNDGNGSFYAGNPNCDEPPASIPTFRCFGSKSTDTRSVAVGDVDGNGTLDIITGNRGQSKIYLNDGYGNFGDSRDIGQSADTRSVAVGDIDGNGTLDIITGNYAQRSKIYLNDGYGNFGDSRDVGQSADTRSVAVGDIDGDGTLDIITGNYGHSILFFNDGHANFPLAGIISYSAYAESTGVGNVDDNDSLDLITVNSGKSKVYLNGGSGHYFEDGYPVGKPADVEPDVAQSVAVGDVDGNGTLDIITGNRGQSSKVYLNDGHGHFDHGHDIGQPAYTESVAVGDVDGNLTLDIIEANSDQTIVYLNNGHINFDDGHAVGTLSRVQSVLVGDIDGSGTLDIIANAGQTIIYLKKGNGKFDDGYAIDQITVRGSIAIGDVDDNGTLDIIETNFYQTKVYLNDGHGNFGDSRDIGQSTGMSSVAVGDVDGNGTLDIITGNSGQNSKVYLNDGHGHFDNGHDIGQPADTRSVAVGDVDGNDTLDIIIGNYGQRSKVYLNNGHGNFDNGHDIGEPADASSVAVGDVDGNGTLDIIIGNYSQTNKVYLNDGYGNFYKNSASCDEAPTSLPTFRCIGSEPGGTSSIAVSDIDGNSTLDIIIGSYSYGIKVYLNKGNGNFDKGYTVGEIDITDGVVVGDVNSNATPDIIAGRRDQIMIYNLLRVMPRSTNTFPILTVTRPITTANAGFYSSPNLVISQTIPITYTLFDPDGHRAGHVEAFYSLNGGGKWERAWPLTKTISTTFNLVTRRDGYPVTHIFYWDTFASGFFGQSDNVALRFVAYPQSNQPTAINTYRYTNTVSGPYQWPYVSATTFPFRVRGTQVQVITGTTTITSVASVTGTTLITSVVDALVYRLPVTQTRGAEPLGGLATPFHTDSRGFLQGRGRIAISDTLVALLPVSLPPIMTERYSDTLRLYYTSARPEIKGEEVGSVIKPGVQTLTVTTDSPLLLFDLDVSLEWDARNDKPFREQLARDLKRTSELLYIWTHGQAALGSITVYHDRQQWQEADIRILANNRLRPNADLGGVVSQLMTEPITVTTISTVTYVPGQVRMPVVWNRFGEAGSDSLSEDWPRALAHELGHYLFFLHDNYLGYDKHGAYVSVKNCPGVMANPYTSNEYNSWADWQIPQDSSGNDCEDSLSNRTVGRADWATIEHYYTWLSAPITTEQSSGPSLLPLAVTQVNFADDRLPTSSTMLDVNAFTIIGEVGSQARAFLIDDSHIIDLGRPVRNQINAWGATPGQQLCVFDLAQRQAACLDKVTDSTELTLKPTKAWQPDIIVRPVTQTLQVTVTVGISVAALQARLYPLNSPITSTITLSRTDVKTSGNLFTYRGIFTNVVTDTRDAYIRIWVKDQLLPQVVTDYTIGGSPACTSGQTSTACSYAGGYYYPPCNINGYNCAPVLSSDGQAMLLGRQINFKPGQFYALQTAAAIAPPPPWATQVGQAYRLILAEDMPQLEGASLSLSYLENEVPSGEEASLKIYHYDETAGVWQPLTTTLQSDYNSAVAPITRPGLYTLMSSVELQLTEGWNLVGYPVQETRAVTAVLQSLASTQALSYSVVYGYDATRTDDPWRVFGPVTGTTQLTRTIWITDLSELTFGQGYFLYATEAAILKLTGITKATEPLTTTMPQAVLNHLLRVPPATFYAEIQGEPGMPHEVSVESKINDQLCGKGILVLQAKSATYSGIIKVDAGEGETSHCGVTNEMVTFSLQVPQKMIACAKWDNTYIQQLTFQAASPTDSCTQEP